jgi:Ser/Thr protein kinase RdoA (MazF antagonist)
VVHGDLHPWNVAYGPAATRVFDWTDAAVSHAFVDLATYVFRTNDQAVRRRLIDAHVSVWSTVGSEQSLREAVGLGLVVGALYQVQSYRALLPTRWGTARTTDSRAPTSPWIKRSLTCHELGLESPA